MTLLQFAIGAANDVIDAPVDAGRKPGKPIASGQLGTELAIGIAVAAAGGGLALAFSVDGHLGALAVVVLLIGLAYDLRFKGTPLSWLPFAIGIPLLPVFGFLGTREPLPAVVTLVVPVAGVAGAALAIANAMVDIERDVAAGRDSVASALGSPRAGWLVVALQSVVGLLAVASAVLIGFDVPVLVGVGGASVAVVGAAEAGRRADEPGAREWSWRGQALGAAALAVVWLAAAIRSGQL
jgi:4-hydroxybenzoate polyprenyltransferase